MTAFNIFVLSENLDLVQTTFGNEFPDGRSTAIWMMWRYPIGLCEINWSTCTWAEVFSESGKCTDQKDCTAILFNMNLQLQVFNRQNVYIHLRMWGLDNLNILKCMVSLIRYITRFNTRLDLLCAFLLMRTTMRQQRRMSRADPVLFPDVP